MPLPCILLVLTCCKMYTLPVLNGFSEQVHNCVEKTARWGGVTPRNAALAGDNTVDSANTV